MKIILTAAAAVFAFANTALAGTTWEPPRDVSGDSDGTAALILLGLLGVVIATSKMSSGRMKAEAIPEEFAEENN